jgi:hypothetical protein
MTAKIWIRKDVDPKQPDIEMTANQVRAKLSGTFKQPEVAMKTATKDNPVSNGYAWYYPKEQTSCK